MNTEDISESLWAIPPPSLPLGRDEVHVWRATLEPPASQVEALQRTLAADERARAARFLFPRDRAHFTVARGILRAILARYLAREPGTLHFRYSDYGQPLFIQEAGDDLLSFNVTHSHALALYAVARGQAVGIDLEYIKEDIEYKQIAERFFSPDEVRALREVAPEMQPHAFFNCWTRKEAYLKARGMGLSLPLEHFDVSLAPGAPVALLSSREEGLDIACWSLHELAPGPGYAAALAVEGPVGRICRWQWAG